jgi:CHAD domain-containing protein
LEHYEQRTNPEILHRIRVELKKIKVLFHLVAFCSGNFNAKRAYKPLRKIFRKAGRIRKFDVVSRLLHEYKIDDVKQGILSEIQKKRKYITSFKNNIPDFQRIVRGYEKKIKKYFEQVHAECLKKYLLNKEYEVQKELFPRSHLRELHESRKLIKEIIYLSPLNKDASLDTQYYYSIQDFIGSWHDKQTLMQLLRKKGCHLHLQIIKKLKAESKNDIKKLKLFIAET